MKAAQAGESAQLRSWKFCDKSTASSGHLVFGWSVIYALIFLLSRNQRIKKKTVL